MFAFPSKQTLAVWVRFQPIADIKARVQNAMMDEDEQRWEETLKQAPNQNVDEPPR